MISCNRSILSTVHNPSNFLLAAPARPHPHTRVPTTRGGLYLRPIHRVFRGPVAEIARNHAPLLAFGQGGDQFLRSVRLPSFFVSVRSTSRYKAPIRPLQRTYTLKIAPDPSKPPDHPPPAAPSPPTFPKLEPLRKPSRNRPQSSESIPSRLCFNLCTKPRTLSPTTNRFPPPAERTSYREYRSLFCFISLYSGGGLLF